MTLDIATIVSRLTPHGTGAIAVLAVRGPAAWPVVRSRFRPASKKPLPEDMPDVGTVTFGHFGGEGLADEVVVTVKQSPSQPWMEIHAHGGQHVIEWLLELLFQNGVTAISPTDFFRLVEPPGRAAAWEALSHAQTARTAAILLDQANGAMERALADIETLQQSGDEAAALARIDAILKHKDLGRHLTRPWNVVIAGAPNVGKSSLVNALAGYQRSVVAPVPGTTRDVVTVSLAIDGWPVILSDTAGLRDEATGLERTGIDAARSTLVHADLILWLLDSTALPVLPDAETAARQPLFVVNKIDQPAAWDFAMVTNRVSVSAQTGAGIAGLCDAISQRLVPQPPQPGEAVPFGESMVDKLCELRSAINGGSKNAMTGVTMNVAS